jgi:hypothetical protein
MNAFVGTIETSDRVLAASMLLSLTNLSDSLSIYRQANTGLA